MRVLSLHPDTLSSQYRGVLAYNLADDDAAAKAAAEAKAKEETAAKAEAEKKAKEAEGTEGRISELAKANKELKAQLKAIEDAKKAEEDEKAKKKGDYEKLLKEREDALLAEKTAREQAGSKLEKYEADAKKRLDEGLKSITDADKQKSAKAMLDGRPLEEQIALLPEVLKLAGGTAASTFGGATPASSATPGQTEVTKMKARYEELLHKANVTPQEMRERHDLMVKLQRVWDEEQQKKPAS